MRFAKKICAALTAVIMLTSAATGFAADTGTTAAIDGSPSGIAVAQDGSLLVTDVRSMVVWKITDWKAGTYAGVSGQRDLIGVAIGGKADGELLKASFRTPFAIVPYQDGWALSDTDNNTIRLISGGRVSTLAGGTGGFKDGDKANALFNRPTGLAVGDDGSLYIADTGNHAIRKMDASGTVTLYAGGQEGCGDGTREQARMSEPTGLYWYDGKLFVADTGNHRILVIEDDSVTVLAGGDTNSGDEDRIHGGFYRNGSVQNAGFSNPQGVLAVEGAVYVADSGNGAVRRIADGTVTTVLPETETASYPISPRGMAVAGGKLYVCDTLARLVFSIPLAPETPQYTDIKPGDAGYGAAVEMYRLGIFRGVDAQTFSPDGVMTRGQFVTALSRLHTALFPDAIIAGDGHFDDVPDDMYYTGAALWGQSNGFVDGTGGGLYRPENTVTREMMACFLYKYAKYCGVDVTAGRSVLEAYPDSGQISFWAQDAMAWAVKAGLFGDGPLNPRGNATRTQGVEFFTGFMELM